MMHIFPTGLSYISKFLGVIYTCAGGVLFYSKFDKVPGSTMPHEWHF